jgi:regulator of replication initiation timing
MESTDGIPVLVDGSGRHTSQRRGGSSSRRRPSGSDDRERRGHGHGSSSRNRPENNTTTSNSNNKSRGDDNQKATTSKKPRPKQRRRRRDVFAEPEEVEPYTTDVDADVDVDGGVNDNDGVVVDQFLHPCGHEETGRQQQVLKKKQQTLFLELQRSRENYKKGKEWMDELRRSVLDTLKENEEWIGVARDALEQWEVAVTMNAEIVDENKRLQDENMFLKSQLDHHQMSEREIESTMSRKQQQVATENERLWEAYHVGQTKMAHMESDQKEAFKAIDFCMRTEVQHKDLQWRKERQYLERRLAKYEAQLERMAQAQASATGTRTPTTTTKQEEPGGAASRSNGEGKQRREATKEQQDRRTDEYSSRRPTRRESDRLHVVTQPDKPPANESSLTRSQVQNRCRPLVPITASKPQSSISPDSAPRPFGLASGAEILMHGKLCKMLTLDDGSDGDLKKKAVVSKQSSFQRSLSPSLTMRKQRASTLKPATKDELQRTSRYGASGSGRTERQQLNLMLTRISDSFDQDHDKDGSQSPSRADTATTESSTRTSSRRANRSSSAAAARTRKQKENRSIKNMNVSERLDKLVRLAKRQQESLVVAAASATVGEDDALSISCNSYIYQQLLRDSVELEEVADQLRSNIEHDYDPACYEDSNDRLFNEANAMHSPLPFTSATNRRVLDFMPPLLPPTKQSSSGCLSSSDKSKIGSYCGSAPSLVMDEDGRPVFVSLATEATATLIPEAVVVPLSPPPSLERSQRRHRLRKLR